MEKPKVEIKINLNWWIPWTAGWFFFIGYTNFFAGATQLTWYNQLSLTAISYLIWPVLLGMYLGKP